MSTKIHLIYLYVTELLITKRKYFISTNNNYNKCLFGIELMGKNRQVLCFYILLNYH